MHRGIGIGTRGRMEFHELSRVRAAARHARRVYPGAVGELLGRELTAHADFGYRFDVDGLVPRLVAEVLATPQAEVDHDARPRRVLHQGQPAA